MRILIVLPEQHRATGNEVTAERHSLGLSSLGHEVRLMRVSPDDGAALQSSVAEFAPDVIHLLHAYRCGRPWLEAGLTRCPTVVTLTGTDFYGGLDLSDQGPIIRRVLSSVQRILSQNRRMLFELQDLFPDLAAKCKYLPPGIILGNDSTSLQREHFAGEGIPLFLHPAGVRPVKGNLELLEYFDGVAAAGLEFAVAFCGPALDSSYSARFLEGVACRPWAHYLGVIPAAAIPDLLSRVDVVLNNSQSEGLPNALLEAAVLGVPILARAIAGNLEVVEENVNGLLYHDKLSFQQKASSLCIDRALRRRLTRPSLGRYSPERETLVLLDLYREAVQLFADRSL